MAAAKSRTQTEEANTRSKNTKAAKEIRVRAVFQQKGGEAKALRQRIRDPRKECVREPRGGKEAMGQEIGASVCCWEVLHEN